MTSVEPMARYAQALTRLGVDPSARLFYDVHVTADACHSVIALERMVGGLVAAEPQLGADLLFGATAVMLVEERFDRRLLEAWSAGLSSLHPAPIDLTRAVSRRRATPDASPATLWPTVVVDRLKVPTSHGDPAA